MVEDSDGAAVATRDGGPEHGEVVLALAESENLGLCSSVHAVEIETMQVGLHLSENVGPVGDVSVTMVPVVDDPDVTVSRLVKQAADRHEVGRFSTPSAVIVESKLATQFRGLLDKGPYGGSSSGDIFGLRFQVGTPEGVPDLRMKIVFPEESEGLLALSPEGKVFNALLLILPDFLFELGDMPGSPVVGTTLEAESGEHCGSLGGATLGGIERDNTPCHEVALLQVVRHFDGEAADGREKSQGAGNGEDLGHAEW